MKYSKTIILKDGRTCLLRSCAASDAAEVHACFNMAHSQTDNLLTYPDENTFTAEAEAKFLAGKEADDRALELCAIVDGEMVATAGIDPVGNKYKIKHRAEFGISVIKSMWGLGIGLAMTETCIECARMAGYTQLELDVVADNAPAISLYKKVGFSEYGRNPKAYLSRTAGWQTLILMRLEL